MFGHLEFYFGKYVRLECNPIPALISGSFQFHNRSVRIFDHRVFIRVVKQTQNAIALFAKLRIAICDFCENCESPSEAIMLESAQSSSKKNLSRGCPLKIKMFDFASLAIFPNATYQENRLFCLRNCAPLSKVRLHCLRDCDFIAIAICNFAIFAIHFTTSIN